MFQSAMLSKSFSLMEIISQADVVVKGVMFVLLLGSILSWTIIFEKTILIWFHVKKADEFEKMLWKEEQIEALYNKIKSDNSNLMGNMFKLGVEGYKDYGTYSSSLSKRQYIYEAMCIEYYYVLDKLDKNVSLLATIGSSAPFIGLFGTVWGIIHSFQSMAVSQNTNLLVVAPGLSEALLATALGLAVAIPASIFYNKFTTILTRFSNRLKNFSKKLSRVLEKKISDKIRNIREHSRYAEQTTVN